MGGEMGIAFSPSHSVPVSGNQEEHLNVGSRVNEWRQTRRREQPMLTELPHWRQSLVPGE
jgi:hypothetical protein